MGLGDSQWPAGQMVHPQSGGKDGWVGFIEKDLRRGAVVPGYLSSASEQTKSGYKAKMIKTPVTGGILFAVFSFSTAEVPDAISSLQQLLRFSCREQAWLFPQHLCETDLCCFQGLSVACRDLFYILPQSSQRGEY